MAARRGSRDDAAGILTVVLAAIAFGFASLPIVVLLGGSEGAIVAIAGMYGSALAILLPVWARLRGADRGAKRVERRGDD